MMKTYDEISKNQYYEILNGGIGYFLNEDHIKKEVVNCSIREVDAIKSIGFEVESSQIFEDVKKDRLSLYKNNIIPSYIITKIEDEYFIVMEIIKINSNRYRDHYDNKYYKCDQINGLVEFLKSNYVN